MKPTAIKKPTTAQLMLTLGSRVLYERDNGETTEHEVCALPTKLGGHTWVVWLKDVAACVALSRCTPIYESKNHETKTP